MEPRAFERAKPFRPAGESRSGMKNTTKQQKSRSQSQNTDAEQVGVATTTSRGGDLRTGEGLLEVRSVFTMWKDSTGLDYKILCSVLFHYL